MSAKARRDPSSIVGTFLALPMYLFRCMVGKRGIQNTPHISSPIGHAPVQGAAPVVRNVPPSHLLAEA